MKMNCHDMVENIFQGINGGALDRPGSQIYFRIGFSMLIAIQHTTRQYTVIDSTMVSFSLLEVCPPPSGRIECMWPTNDFCTHVPHGSYIPQPHINMVPIDVEQGRWSFDTEWLSARTSGDDDRGFLFADSKWWNRIEHSWRDDPRDIGQKVSVWLTALKPHIWFEHAQYYLQCVRECLNDILHCKDICIVLQFLNTIDMDQHILARMQREDEMRIRGTPSMH